MKKFKILIFLNLIIFLTSCSTVKEGFINQKKNNSDEFLVKKKSPLVMPPDYNKLPVPKNEKNEKNVKNLEDNNIKKLIKSSNKKVLDTTKLEVNENFEESVLKKIKND